MPDFERVTRSLELHLAKSPVEEAYIRGKHAGLDKARKQIAVLFTLTSLALLIVCAISAFPLKGL